MYKAFTTNCPYYIYLDVEVASSCITTHVSEQLNWLLKDLYGWKEIHLEANLARN
jgi:hypothetical protein